jgi:hypothetical protein
LYDGQRIRQSLRTRSRQIADRRLTAIVKSLEAKTDEHDIGSPGNSAAAPIRVGAPQRTVSAAVERFLKSHGEIGQDGKYRGNLECGTWRKYRSGLGLLASFCDEQRTTELAGVNLDALEDFHRSRSISLVTWKVELQTLRTFFSYCVSHKWITTNPAKELKAPRNIKPNEVMPYTLLEGEPNLCGL